MDDPILHLTYYQIIKTQNGNVKRRFMNRYYNSNLVETDDLFKKSFGIDPTTTKEVVRAIKITKEQQTLNRQAYVNWCESQGVPCW